METVKGQNTVQDNQPSQAEGDRETIEADLNEKSDINKAAEGKVIPSEGKPSQAEGERDKS
ncbi:MAG: hypothetical protein JWP00_3825 [Chloroflexi bacterium]|nr:hypothetical protein [Chloroflexota bacterium]